MALSTPTNLAGVTNTDNNATIATGTIAPSSDALLIVSVGQSTASDISLSSIGTTLSNVGSWTIVQNVIQWQSGPNRFLNGAIAYAKVTGSPGTGTITATFGSSTRVKIMRVAQVTGHDTTTPVVQSKTNTGTGTGLTVTLDNTPNAANMVFASVFDTGLGTITPGSGFTEIGETTIDAAQDITIQTEYDYQSADTTADWTTLAGVGNVGVAIEIKELNNPPTVALNSPADSATGVSTTPTLEFTGTDGDGDDVRYNIQIDTANTFDSQGGAVDSYSESNQDSEASIDQPSPIGNGVGVAQSFTGNGGAVTSAKLYLKKASSPTGNATAVIYAHSGTFGTSSVPTGSALATSDNFDVSTLTTSYQLIEFTFSSPYTTANGTKYCVAILYSSGSGGSVVVGYDASSASHAGNFSFNAGVSWSPNSSNDVCFEILSTAPLINAVSGTDAGFSNTTDGGDTDPFDSGDKADYDVQAGDTLSAATTYYWRVSATDPSGSNTYGAWATTRSFTTAAGGGGGDDQAAWPVFTTNSFRGPTFA